MSAETLRRAAALMRERAEAATPGPWVDECEFHQDHGGADTYHHVVSADRHISEVEAQPDATHIAYWHPAVALAVADLLDTAALGCEVMAPLDWDYPEGPMDCTGSLRPEFTKALAVARAYLGETP